MPKNKVLGNGFLDLILMILQNILKKLEVY